MKTIQIYIEFCQIKTVQIKKETSIVMKYTEHNIR